VIELKVGNAVRTPAGRDGIVTRLFGDEMDHALVTCANAEEMRPTKVLTRLITDDGLAERVRVLISLLKNPHIKGPHVSRELMVEWLEEALDAESAEEPEDRAWGAVAECQLAEMEAEPAEEPTPQPVTRQELASVIEDVRLALVYADPAALETVVRRLRAGEEKP